MRSPTTLLLTVITSLFLLSACEDQSEDASSCRYYIQQDLDTQDYNSAIDRLSSTTCQETYPDNEYLVDRASAYLGVSGYTFPDILSAALDDSEDGGDALSDFTSSIAELKNDDSIEYLDLATDDFTNYLGDDCSNLTNITSTEEGICLVQGVVSLTKTALALDFLSGTGDSSIEDSETLDLSICALQHSTNTTVDTSLCLITEDDVKFSNDVDYTLLTITDANDSSISEYFLETNITGDTVHSIVYTNGFCTTDFTEREVVTDNIHTLLAGSLTAEQEADISYICPSEDGDDDSVNDLLVNAFNDAIDNIDSLNSDDDAELKEAIDDFTSTVDATRTSNTDEDYTLTDIIDYLAGL